MRCDGSDIIANWKNEPIHLLPPVESPFHSPIRFGVVIGTFSAVPYIHLQLESRKRFFPNVPCLVHNDGTHNCEILRNLCEQYSCDFQHNRSRRAPSVGDLSVYVGGLLWSETRSVDILVKLSRRWIFLTNWEISLTQLAQASGYHTYSSYCCASGFGFRTECLAIKVSSWASDVFMVPAMGRIRANQSVFVEGYLHQFAQDFERNNSSLSDEWRRTHPMPEDKHGYAMWELMGTNRACKSPLYLWHDASTHLEYFQLSRAWGLQYNIDDFLDPNK